MKTDGQGGVGERVVDFDAVEVTATLGMLESTERAAEHIRSWTANSSHDVLKS